LLTTASSEASGCAACASPAAAALGRPKLARGSVPEMIAASRGAPPLAGRLARRKLPSTPHSTWSTSATSIASCLG
jgi:hypothetical protein